MRFLSFGIAKVCKFSLHPNFFVNFFEKIVSLRGLKGVNGVLPKSRSYGYRSFFKNDQGAHS